MIVEGSACMEMAYRDRWAAEIAAMRRVLGGFAMKEERKWGKPTYTVDEKNVVIIPPFELTAVVPCWPEKTCSARQNASRTLCAAPG